MKKILIVYATAGIGHAKAAIAVKKAFDVLRSGNSAFRERCKDIEVRLIDSLDYTTPMFRFVYQGIYLLLIRRLRLVWGLFYYLTNNPLVNRITKMLRRMTNWVNARKFVTFVTSYKPDVVISTHFLGTEVISHLKKAGRLDTRLICVLTDYRLHAFWIADNVDTYVVGSAPAKKDLIRWDIAAEKIKTYGIPVEPEFVVGPQPAKDRVRKKLGIDEGRFTVLIVGGGFGVGPIEEIIRVVEQTHKSLQVIVVCGHNQNLCGRIAALKKKSRLVLYEFGFIENMYELMEAADVLISKSGGISVSEALAKELPLLVIAPIPGQESYNCEFLVKHGAALQIRSLNDLTTTLNDCMEDAGMLPRMREQIRNIRRPGALFDIAQDAVDWIEHE